MSRLYKDLETALLNYLRGTAMPASPSSLELGLSFSNPLDDASGLRMQVQ